MTGWRVLPLAVAMAACAAAPGSLPVDQAENAPRGEADRWGAVRPGATDAETLTALQAAVRADTALAWGRGDASSLEFTSEDVTWSDGSLGCPRPGLMYTQALVPGWRLVVRHDGRERIYHASRRGQWLQCPAGRAVRPVPGAAIR